MNKMKSGTMKVDEQSYQNKIPKVYICQALNPSVVNSSILLVDLKAGCGSNTAEVPLLIFREAKNVKKGGQLTGVHMLLLKEKSILIQVSPLNTFKNLSREGGMYGCMVLMPLEACFTDHTSFVEVTEQKMLLTLMCAMFVAHVMGEVSSINTVFDNENHSIHRVMITIQLDRRKVATQEM
ncbi:hypothetical protein HID58_070538 [Brassica napus]|uniref:Uncharacterized protein n=1 Tax=Brassica napus TaxID=3708 RepID=A0ABQ7YZ19_BRANA|nr:hypothetical protein HID58_070538 [Brassica napus]